MSAQPCGCDPEENNHLCQGHRDDIIRDASGRAFIATDSGYQMGVSPFVVKDSGVRAAYDSGMVRDTDANKVQYHRVTFGPMFERYARHLTVAATTKYLDDPDGTPNWMKAHTWIEWARFRASAFRHFIQWFMGATDEDHAAAVYFNINGAEYVKGRLPNDPNQ